MAEISINEYIRTDNGIIIKYQFLEESENFEVFFGQKGKGFTFEDMEEFEDFINQRVVKHSKNIIDLIEEGDYINGKLIHKVDIRENSAYIYYGNCKTFADYQINSIVTKEQFSQMEYKLEE